MESPLGLLRNSQSLESSKSSESKFQIQAASDLNSEKTERANFPEVLKRHKCVENISAMTRKGQKEGQEKWVSLVGQLSWVKPYQYIFKSILCVEMFAHSTCDGGESLNFASTLKLLPLKIL